MKKKNNIKNVIGKDFYVHVFQSFIMAFCVFCLFIYLCTNKNMPRVQGVAPEAPSCHTQPLQLKI